ncbi:MAG: hypothetical protein JETCAE01_30770 [Anaerolineaceae bacterium]|nr:MAG: hypothetical protein JETCAE01_30770 [Anaerolineaceae bacterium]
MTLYLQTRPFQYAYPFSRRLVRRRTGQPSVRALDVNIREEDDAYTLSALVPGLKAEDLNIQVLQDIVIIEGEFKDEEASYLMNELPRGAFRRSLRLPSEIDSGKVEARIADGVLTLILPKAESAKPKKIQVEVR